VPDPDWGSLRRGTWASKRDDEFGFLFGFLFGLLFDFLNVLVNEERNKAGSWIRV